jgi:hypothetical protein
MFLSPRSHLTIPAVATCIPGRRTRRHASTCDSRHGLNTQFRLPDLLRQSVYSRLAGYEDLNDAARLATDPTFRLLGSPNMWDRGAALTSTLHWPSC